MMMWPDGDGGLGQQTTQSACDSEVGDCGDGTCPLPYGAPFSEPAWHPAYALFLTPRSHHYRPNSSPSENRSQSHLMSPRPVFSVVSTPLGPGVREVISMCSPN